MDKNQAKRLIVETFENSFDKEKFIRFLKNLLKKYEEKTFTYQGNYIPDPFKGYIENLERIGKYTYDDKEIDLLVVKLKKETSLERARAMQRNFIAWYLKVSRGGKLKDAALVAFVSPDSEDWRFSLVKMEYTFEETPKGKVKVREEFTPAKRWSFLVGKNENCHTAQSRFIQLLENDNWKPTLEDLEEAFNVEIVTKEFFEKYRDLFIKTKIELDKILHKNSIVKTEFESKNINTVDFAKKLLGQIVFLYFLQKKGWFGVEKRNSWGTGPKDFMRMLFNKEYGEYQNFYNDIFEPLFYEALRTDRSADGHYYSRFNCKIPFLNGGLFDPINNFDWVKVDINLPNELFSNTNYTQEGDIGDGILDVFDRYNFTVNEEEPFEKEVALDPELLGKIYEKLNAIRSENFDEFLKVLNSGKKGEEAKFNKEYGVYYTPREIVHYMCQESLINYLETELNGKVSRDDLGKFFKYADSQEIEKVAIEKAEKIERGEQKSTKYESEIPESIKQNAKKIDKLLADIKICDPAVGSGAFPIGMMHEIVRLRQLLSIYTEEDTKSYDLKRNCIENSIYGVDIDPGAVEICKLRFWLSLIVDEEDFYNIKPLPNLDYKVVCGDSLLGIPEKLLPDDKISSIIEEKKRILFSTTSPVDKIRIKNEIEDLFSKQLEFLSVYKTVKSSINKVKFDFHIHFSEVFHKKGGFDIVIGNPPYISTKGVTSEQKKQLEQHFGFADDTYNHFYFKGMEILKKNGILAYISSKTFWTIQTKKNLRDLLLKNKIIQLFDTANPFESGMVDTCVAIVQKQKAEEKHQITFLDGKRSISEPERYTVLQKVFVTAPNQVFFIPTPQNIKIYKHLVKAVNELLNQWWDLISTSKNIEKNKHTLEQYRKNLKPGDITLLGLITEGGQGLATANNGKYVAVLEGTKWAENVRKQRPEKLLLAKEFCKKQNIKNKQDAQAFLNTLSEKEIRMLFDDLKEKYGRDKFGQGWLYRIVSKDEIADVNKLTEDEKLNGINGEKTFVPYDKGDKDGNRWYAPTPYYIDWSKENVKILQSNPKARWQGYQFYFREGFCWTNVSTPIRKKSMFIKCRIKEKTINDVGSMSLYSTLNFISAKYFVCLLNSRFLFDFLKTFINQSVNLQINDIRQLPIIIPTSDQLKQFEDIFNQAYTTQRQKFEGKITEEEAEIKLNEIQKELDEMVGGMYM
ncbi:MAG: Eco57I restriction-modification methylase domain-containing protein [candidate division WOR-3 bacterium]